VSIGCDIVHEHPNADGAKLGEATYRDFLIYTKQIERLEHGVFMDFGSAVTGPEVYLKALAMCRNVAHQRGERIGHFTTAVFDLLDLEGKDVHSLSVGELTPEQVLSRRLDSEGIQGDERAELEKRFEIALQALQNKDPLQ
jgi:hypothetical protein